MIGGAVATATARLSSSGSPRRTNPAEPWMVTVAPRTRAANASRAPVAPRATRRFATSNASSKPTTALDMQPSKARTATRTGRRVDSITAGVTAGVTAGSVRTDGRAAQRRGSMSREHRRPTLEARLERLGGVPGVEQSDDVRDRARETGGVAAVGPGKRLADRSLEREGSGLADPLGEPAAEALRFRR